MEQILTILDSDKIGCGGAEGILEQIVYENLRRNNRVHIFFIRKAFYLDWEKVTNKNLILHYGNGTVWGLIYNLLKCRNIEFKYAFTSLVLHTACLGMLRRFRLINISKFIGRESTSIFCRFSGMKLFFIKLLYFIGYPAVDVLICQTEEMKKQLLNNLKWLEKSAKVVVVPNPVDLDRVRYASREYIKLDQYGDYIVAAGRLATVKGFDILIKSYQILRKEYKNINLVILGAGPLEDELKKQVNNFHLDDNVFFPGLVNNVYPYFKGAKLCVISSIIEGFPNVLLQMMSQNTKVVSTLCAGGIGEISGLFTCKTGNEIDLANAMSLCLESDTTECRRQFDMELSKRSIVCFVDKVINY